LAHLEFLLIEREKKWSEDGPLQAIEGDRKLDMATTWTLSERPAKNSGLVVSSAIPYITLQIIR